MRTFKEYLAEVLDLDMRKKSRDTEFTRSILYNAGDKWDPEDHKNAEHISTTSSGHHIYKTRGHHIYKTGSRSNIMYHAYDPKTKRSTIAVYGKEHKGVLSSLNLASHKTNTLKAHDFYHHLLKHHLTALATDTQSEGGKGVWEKLAKKPGVKIHGWSKGKPVNVKFGEDETHAKAGDYIENGQDIRRMELVAHIK